MEILAIRMTALRKERKLSRLAASQAVGVSPKSYERYEKAEREPTASVLVALADYYDVSVDYLLGRTDQK